MNSYQELKDAFQAETQRPSAVPADQVRRFSDEAGERINRYLGLNLGPLIGDNDVNDVLLYDSNLYLYGMMEAYSRWTRDWDEARFYDERWFREADNWNITDTGNPSKTDQESPAVCSEYEQAAAEAT